MECLENAIARVKSWDEVAVYVSLINQCGSLNALSLGKALHSRLNQTGRDRETFVGNHLIQMYGKCGCLPEAYSVFKNLRHPNVYSCNMLIGSYTHNKQLQKARRFFDTTNAKDVYTWTIMIASYAQDGSELSARNLFVQMPEKDLPTWNAMLTAYAQNGNSKQATQLLKRMDLEGLSPNQITFVNMFASFLHPEDVSSAEKLHRRMLEDESFVDLDVAVGNSLIAMYGRCGSISNAEKTFDAMSVKNVISWTSLITSYAQNGYGAESLQTFKLMDLEGVHPNFVTFTSAIEACTCIGALAEGRTLHLNAKDCGEDTNVVVSTALVNMYAKCGSLFSARQVFDKMLQRNVLSWSSMIAAYAQSGHSSLALELFSAMGVEGQLPNAITFVVVLTACVHAGKLQEGWSYFVSISRDYGIRLISDHYACMVDLLARTGRLEEAQDLLQNMPFQPDSSALTAYLGSCKTHLDAGKGSRAVEQLVKIGSLNASPYMLLSNIMASSKTDA